MIDGYDSTIISNIPRDAGVVVCYMDLRFKNDGAAIAQFPHLAAEGRIVTLTAGLAMDAIGIDCEPGNTNPRQAALWLHEKLGVGAHRPVAYADLSDMRTLISELHLLGVPTPAPGPGRPVRLYSAHPTGVKHICGPVTCGFPVEMDATQWWFSSIGNPGGPDLDKNVFRDDFFQRAGQPQPQPQPPKREEIVSIAATTNVDGRVELFVEAQDGSIWHTYQEFAPGTKNITGWSGGVPNVTNAKLRPLAPPPGK